MVVVWMGKQEKWRIVVGDWVFILDVLVIEIFSGLLCWQGFEKQSQCFQNMVVGVVIVQGSVREVGVKMGNIEEKREVESVGILEFGKGWSDKFGVYFK